LFKLFHFVHFFGIQLIDIVSKLGVFLHQAIKLLEPLAVQSEQLGVELVLDNGGGDFESFLEVINLLDDHQSTVPNPVLVELDVVLFVEVEVQVANGFIPY